MKSNISLASYKDQLLVRSNRGKSIFKLFLPDLVEVNAGRFKNCKNPFYEDRKASFSIYFYENDWRFFDHGDNSFKGNAFDFAVMWYERKLSMKLKFNEMLDRLNKDLSSSSTSNGQELISPKENFPSNESIKLNLYDLTKRELDSNDLIFWKQYGISEEILEQNKVISLRSSRSFNEEQESWKEQTYNDLAFAYLGQGYAKVYQPKGKFKFFWLGNKPKEYVFGKNNLPDFGNGDLVILTGGEKDALTLMSLGYFAVSLSSENSNLPKDFGRDLYERQLTPVVLYDIDQTGLKRGEDVSSELKCRNIVLPRTLIEKGGKDVSDWIKLGMPIDVLKELINGDNCESMEADSTQNTIASELDNIELEEQIERKEMRSFPTEIYPVEIQKIISETHKHLGFPIDFISCSILYACALSIGNTHKVSVKTGWEESSLLYMALVGRPGTNKSHPLSFALAPLFERDKISYSEYIKKQEKFDSIMDQQKREKPKEDTEKPVKPVWQKSLVSDFTLEALSEVHFNNKRGIGVYADELAGWFKNFNRYNKGSEVEFWLSSWNSKPINIDRKSGERIFIPSPFISVIGTIQNGILDELSKGSRDQNGFMDRILFVIPENLQKSYWNETNLSFNIIKQWSNILNKLINLSVNLDEHENPKPLVLLFESEAEKLLYEWQRDNVDKCNDTESDTLSGIYSKMEVYAIRFSLILEMVKWACGEGEKHVITVDSVKGAIKLAEYFANAAIKVNSIITCNDPLEKLTLKKRNLYNSLPQEFTKAEGNIVAEQQGIPIRTFATFITNKDFFAIVSRGNYKKIV